jgi:hypothetical protein
LQKQGHERATAGQNIAARGSARLCGTALCGKETYLLTSILFLLCFKRKRAPRPAAEAIFKLTIHNSQNNTIFALCQ